MEAMSLEDTEKRLGSSPGVVLQIYFKYNYISAEKK